MVESAPQDRKRLLPSAANPSDPAMKAKKPICGEKPPRRAVAICSGIAIAASVRSALRSPVKSLARNDASDRNTGQLVFAVSSAINSRLSAQRQRTRKYSDIAPPKASHQWPLFGARLGDGLADCRQRRGVVEGEAFALRPQAEVAPQRRKIGRHGFRPHLVVKFCQHVDADGLVGGGEGGVDRPG